MLGVEGFTRVRAARVAVVGLGGVGCHAAIALARSGVGALLLVDFDRVTESSLNRNPLAVLADVGRLKTDALAERLGATCPDTSIETARAFVDETSAPAVLTGRIDAVVDAIDGVTPKSDLLAHCVRAGLPIVSSMGASSWRGVPEVRVMDLADTTGCPLARQVRRRLRQRGIAGGVTCVVSARGSYAPPGQPDEREASLSRGRPRRRLPSLITGPGVFGYAVAGVVLDRLSQAHAGPSSPPAT